MFRVPRAGRLSSVVPFVLRCKHEGVLVSRARIGEFVQDPPRLENVYLASDVLRSYLKRHVPEEVTRLSQSLFFFGSWPVGDGLMADDMKARSGAQWSLAIPCYAYGIVEILIPETGLKYAPLFESYVMPCLTILF